MRRRVRLGAVSKLALIAAGALAATGGSVAAQRLDASQPLVGVDYYSTDCIHAGTNLLKDAADPELERDQLFAMHASGLNSLRYTINYTSDPSVANGDRGGALPLPGGDLVEPYRSRLIRYLTDARDAGFTDVTIAFYPYGPNSPIPDSTGPYIDDWNPALYADDWRFIRAVRDLTKQYGPSESHFDLMAEGPPSDQGPADISIRTDDYIKRLYRDYVTAYAAGDVFFTVIDKIPELDDSRLSRLIRTLRSTGEPLPNWWGLDIEYTGNVAYQNLTDADATLRAYGVDGSLALGETAYENFGVADAVQRLTKTTGRRVAQVEEYPNWGQPDCWSAPYTGAAYLKVLGIEPGPLRGGVGSSGQLTLTTSDGVPITALRADRYTVLVTDASRRDNFHLVGPGVNRRTGLRFKGTARWTVHVRSGIYRYRSDRPHSRLQGRFQVLIAD